MKNSPKAEKKVLSEFFTTVAAAWFTAGVITTVFVRPINLDEAVYNVSAGILLAYLSLSVAFHFEEQRK